MSRNSFIENATILAISGLVTKFTGLFFRIFLTYIIKPVGMGLYGFPYQIYAFLFTFSIAGIPTAMSKMVSERTAKGDNVSAHKIFKIVFRFLFFIGLLMALLLLGNSKYIAKSAGNEKVIYGLIAISPSLLFVSILAVFRGYFQGQKIMIPTAISEIIEQLGKLVFEIWLASKWIKHGEQFGAAGALLGITLGEFAALVLFFGVYRGNFTQKFGLDRQNKHLLLITRCSNIFNINYLGLK